VQALAAGGLDEAEEVEVREAAANGERGLLDAGPGVDVVGASVLANAVEHGMAHATVAGPVAEADLGDELRADEDGLRAAGGGLVNGWVVVRRCSRRARCRRGRCP
jgi:hypothetical protein